MLNNSVQGIDISSTSWPTSTPLTDKRRALQEAISIGKGIHFDSQSETVGKSHSGGSRKRRRKQQLTSLDYDDDGGSNDSSASWHPDSADENEVENIFTFGM